MAIVRVYTFDNVTVRDNTKMDDELDNIVSYLDSTSTDEIILTFDDAIEPPLTLGSLSKNPVLDLKQNDTSKVYFGNKNGSIESLVSTGLAPFDIISTTVCTNLNLHYLDGVDGAFFNSQNVSGQYFLGNLIIEKLATGSNNLSLLQDGDIHKVRRTSDNASIFELQDMDESTRKIGLGSNLNLKVEYDPITNESSSNNTSFDALRYSDLLEQEKIFSFAGIYNSATTGQTGILLATHIVAMKLPNLLRLRRFTLYKGNSGGVTCYLYKNSVLQATISVANGTDINVPFSIDVDIRPVLGDVFTIKFDSAGNQNYIFAGVTGLT